MVKKGITLVIVESPTKIKKLESILGAGYKVTASRGHIIDLDKKKMSINFSKDFEPEYTISKEKVAVIAEIKKLYDNCNDLLIASDLDREGEMIAWSIAYILKIKDPKRIVFNEITKKAILDAVKSPTKIDQRLVDAQKTRRILDRIVGYEISPLLKTVTGSSLNKLSAGRVQSVVVRLIIDKENEIKEFNKKGLDMYYKCKGEFSGPNNDTILQAVLHNNRSDEEQTKFLKEDQVTKFYELAIKSIYKIHDIVKKKRIQSPQAPFTTSTLQQEASRKLGLSGKKTMDTAQKLYQEGHITYMRTDSTNLSDDALIDLEKYIVDKIGKEYHKLTKYEKKAKNTQEAHEAIRPTDCFVESIDLGPDEKRLYNLIWKRTIASQMKPAEFDVLTCKISISLDDSHMFHSTTETIFFPGYLKIYGKNDMIIDSDNDINTNIDTTLKMGMLVEAKSIICTQEYVKGPTRYDEPSLINKLDPKNLGIGRPATYVKIISNILEKQYVEIQNIEGTEKDSVIFSWKKGGKLKRDIKSIIVGKENNKFVPTDLGYLINDFLIKTFPEIMDYKFTADLEKKIDRVASGKETYKDIMHNFYNNFHPIVVKYKEQNPKTNEFVDKFARQLGIDPGTGSEIIATRSRCGPVVKKTVDGKTVYASINKPLTLDKITVEQAIELLKYPKCLGAYEGNNIFLKKGQYGYYLAMDTLNISLKDLETDPELVTLEKAIELFKNLTKNMVKFVDGNKTYEILDGSYGKYIKITTTSEKTKKKKITNCPFPKNLIDELNTIDLKKIKQIISANKKNTTATATKTKETNTKKSTTVTNTKKSTTGTKATNSITATNTKKSTTGTKATNSITATNTKKSVTITKATNSATTTKQNTIIPKTKTTKSASVAKQKTTIVKASVPKTSMSKNTPVNTN